MGQQTFSDIEYGGRKRKTRREEYLDTMDAIIPWDALVEKIKPFYPGGKRGRPPRGIESMLRMFLLRSWFALSDDAVEDEIYDSYAFRKFMKLNFIQDQAPDSTTLIKFRQMLEKNGLDKVVFEAVKGALEQSGYAFRQGSVKQAAAMVRPPGRGKNQNE